MAVASNSTACCFIVVVAVVLYSNSLLCGFVFDDIPAVVNNKDLEKDAPWSSLLWNDFWGTPMSQERSHKSYRPLTVLSFKLNNVFFGKDPLSYHAINVLLHAGVGVLYYLVCKEIVNVATSCTSSKKNRKDVSHTKYGKVDDRQSCKNGVFEYVPLIAAGLFITHPIHCEAVTGVVGRAELLSAFFMLLVFLMYSKFNVSSTILSSIFCVCAVASKEQGITIAAICAVYDIFIVGNLTPLELVFFRKSSNVETGLRVCILAFVACLALLWRFSIMGGDLPIFDAFDNPASVSSTPSRQFTYNFLLVQNFWLLLNPYPMLCDWTMGTVPVIHDIFDLKNIATMVFWTALIMIAYVVASKRGATPKLLLIGLSIMIFPFLPASNLFFPVGFVIAERVLYVPSMGFCLIVSLGVVKLVDRVPKYKKLIYFWVGLLLFCFSMKTFVRNFDWKSEYTLFESGLKVTQSNAKIWNNIGHTFEADDPEKALLYFTEAARLQPDDIGSHLNVGRMKKQLKMYQEAEESYRRAKDLIPKYKKGGEKIARMVPSHLQLFVQLGNLIKMNHSRLEEANDIYKEAISLRSDFLDAYINRGEILMLMGKMDEAVKCYEDALKNTDKKADVYFNLAVVHSQVGNISASVEYYTYAIQEDPNHIKSLYNSAVIFQETGSKELLERAKVRVTRVLQLEPRNYMALSLMGSIYADYGDEKNAISSWRKVLKLNPNNKSALYNIAHMYAKRDNAVEQALHAIEALLQAHPDYIKGLMLYGQVLLNKKKDHNAAGKAFQKVIAIDPEHIQAQHNYCVAVVESGNLLEAENCMEKVLAMAPEAKYIADNLATIRKHIAKIKAKKHTDGMIFQEKDEEVVGKPKESPPHKVNLPNRKAQEEEEMVYIEPIRKKPSLVKRAGAIMDEAKDAVNSIKTSEGVPKLEHMEATLEKVRSSVKKLSNINQQATSDVEEKCPTASSSKIDEDKNELGHIYELRDKALKVLEELEAKLN